MVGVWQGKAGGKSLIELSIYVVGLRTLRLDSLPISLPLLLGGGMTLLSTGFFDSDTFSTFLGSILGRLPSQF
jgi:hypothetical protein